MRHGQLAVLHLPPAACASATLTSLRQLAASRSQLVQKARRPQTQGLVENGNKFVKDLIRVTDELVRASNGYLGILKNTNCSAINAFEDARAFFLEWQAGVVVGNRFLEHVGGHRRAPELATRQRRPSCQHHRARYRERDFRVEVLEEAQS
ncbi:hypothetical protein RI054_13g65690 [Pseudoscourfieldia marina]